MWRRRNLARGGKSSRRAQRAMGTSAVLAVSSVCCIARGQINSQWNTGSGSWNVAANWTPVDVPDNFGGTIYNVQIGNLAPALNAQVTFIPEDGTSDSINSLALSNGADLFTSGSQLLVTTSTTISGANSFLRIDPHSTPGTTALQSATLSASSGGILNMQGGILSITSALNVDSTSSLIGFGTINLGNADGIVEQAFQNSGLMQLAGTSVTPGTLFLHTNGVDTIDLDGDGELGIVDVSNAVANANLDTLTLVVDGPLSDPFGNFAPGAQLQIGQRDTVTFNDNFAIEPNALIDMNGGTLTATMNGPGAITSITGATFTIGGSAQIDNNMTFAGTANVINVNANSTLTLNGVVSIADASALNLGDTAHLVVGNLLTITEPAGEFNWDGPGNAITTVKGTALLSIDVIRVDNGNDIFEGILNLDDSADVSVVVAATNWTMQGTLNKNNNGLSQVTGDAIIVSGNINVNAGTLDLPQGTFQSGSTATITGALRLSGASYLAGATFGGTGLLRMLGTSTISANTTVNTSVFDWDGTGSGTGHTILNGVTFTVNSATWDPDDAGDMDDDISLGGSGAQLIVNNAGSWTMARTLTANSAAAGVATLGGNSRLVLSGSLANLNVTGNTVATAPLTFGTLSNTAISNTMSLRLAGGNTSGNTNALSGGTISGLGILAADTSRALHGFGTITTTIDFDGASNLLADNGVLTVTGSVVDVGTIGTADVDGTLNIVNAWNSNVASSVSLAGGTLQGGAITVGNTSGISGRGFVSSRVVNTTMLRADSGTLIFQTGANDNDWDGAGNTGSLSAINSGVLEIRDTGAAFAFLGAVNVSAGSRVYASGFGINFNAGSTINLASGTFESDESSSLSGALQVSVGSESTLKVQNNRFLTFEPGSTTTLNGNLRLRNNNVIIEQGATFTGGGALIVDEASHLVVENLGAVGVLLDNRGALRPGNFNGIGRIDLIDYQQSNEGELFVELQGTALNAFDRLVASGDAVIDGYLNLDIDGAFVPALGNTFNILTANTVTGSFDYKDISGMPAGLTFAVKYLTNAVQVQVVNKPFFSADFDDDGDVDPTDLAIWQNAFHLNQLGDANGDNITDIADFTLWRDQFGSGPVPFASPVPEPGTIGLGLLGLLGVGMRRRVRSVSRSVVGALLFVMGLMALTQSASAVPQMTVVNNGLSGGDRQWLVRVAPDPTLFISGNGSLAVELAFEVQFGQLVSATKNAVDWPYDLPRDNSPFVVPDGDGIYADTAADRVYAPLGSNLFNSGSLVTVFTLVTQGSGPVAIHWGGQLVDAGVGPDIVGSLIAQNGKIYGGYQGSAAVGAIPGDANFDGKVNQTDLGRMAQSWQKSGGWTNGDFDGNGLVNVLDLVLMSNNWYSGVLGPSFDEVADGLGLPSAVPEPSVLGLLALAAPCILRRRGRERSTNRAF